MGSEQAKVLTRQKNNHSFNAGDFSSFNIDKIKPNNQFFTHQNKNVSSSLDIRNSSSFAQHQLISSIIQRMPSIAKQSSVLINSKPQLSVKDQNAKLQKLTKKNDQLRKELISINKKLSEQLQKKKIPNLMSQHSKQQNFIESNQDKTKSKFQKIALKRQLQNAYNKTTQYKKQIQELKKNDSPQNNIKLNEGEDKIIQVDQEIHKILKLIESMETVVGKQTRIIRQCQDQIESGQVNDYKKQISALKERVKKWKQVSRIKEKDQKMRHQLLIQFQRKLRQTNGQYLPQFKNYSLTNVQTSRLQTRPGENSGIIQKNSRIVQKPSNKLKRSSQTKKSQKQFRYLPSKLQIEQAQTQLKQQKEKHEQFHRKIDFLLRKKNQLKEQRQKIQQKLILHQKKLDNFNYKKERYMQLIMGNISGGVQINLEGIMSENDNQGQEATSDNLITKGENLEGQVQFDDKKAIKNYDKVFQKLKIITVNIWTNQKNHIVAIQFFYTDGYNFYVGKKSSQNKQLQQKKSLELQENDHLKHVMGIFNNKTKFLQFLVLQSCKGKILKIGKQSFKNDNFHIRTSKAQHPAIITGASTFDGTYWRINRLDFNIVIQ